VSVQPPLVLAPITELTELAAVRAENISSLRAYLGLTRSRHAPTPLALRNTARFCHAYCT